MKPSKQIIQYIIPHPDGYELPVPDSGDVRRELDALHDRIEALELDNKINNETIRRLYLSSCEPKQEPCECDDPNHTGVEHRFTKQEPKKLADYLDAVYSKTMTIAEARKQLLDLFMSCVPDEIKEFTLEFSDEDGGWNDCREQMIKNLEKLK